MTRQCRTATCGNSFPGPLTPDQCRACWLAGVRSPVHDAPTTTARPAATAPVVALPILPPCDIEGAVREACPTCGGEEGRHVRACYHDANPTETCTRGVVGPAVWACADCPHHTDKRFTPRPGDPSVGVSVGCYLWPELVTLQCRLIRSTCGPVPVLISWDHDPAFPDRTEAARRYAAEEGADFQTADTKFGHTAGDAAAYWRGIEWAIARGLAVAAKLSQRMLLVQPRWLQDGAADLLASGLALSTRRCVGRWEFPLRTEAVLMDAGRWNQPAVLAELRKWRFHDRGPAGFSFEDRLPELVATHLGGAYWPWALIGERREAQTPGVVWHDAHPRAEYDRLASRFGVTLPTDFRTDGWGWQLQGGGYSYG